jgi:hypothetical protein
MSTKAMVKRAGIAVLAATALTVLGSAVASAEGTDGSVQARVSATWTGTAPHDTDDSAPSVAADGPLSLGQLVPSSLSQFVPQGLSEFTVTAPDTDSTTPDTDSTAPESDSTSPSPTSVLGTLLVGSLF